MVSFTTRFDYGTFLVTILIGGLIILIVIVLRYNSANDYHFRSPRAAILECIDGAQTGDLICVSYHSKRGRLVRVFTGSVWIHIGFVVRTVHGDPYVLEVARYSPDNQGLMAKPLEWWLDYNSDNLMAWRRYAGRGITSSKLLGVLRRNRHTDVNLHVVDWLQTMYKSDYKGGTQDSYYCSEFVAYLLQELGIIERVYQPSGYKPWELLYGELPFRSGHAYEGPRVLSSGSGGEEDQNTDYEQ